MYSLLMVCLILVCVALTIVVLMQSSKGGGLAGAFGGGGMTTAFGGRGVASFLSKLTTWLASLFMIICIGLTFLKRHNVEQKSLIKAEQQQSGAPAGSVLPLLPAGQQATAPVPSTLPSSNDSVRK
jgi:preprotein translocase subunit SecG